MKKRRYALLTFCLMLLFISVSCSNDPSEYLSDGIRDFKSGDYEAAIANLRKAKYLIPESFEANLYLGESFLKNPQKKDAEYKAKYYLNTAQGLAKTGEESLRASLPLLKIYETQKDHKKIIAQCQTLLDKDRRLLDKQKKYDIYMLRANAYFSLEESGKAVEDYETIVAVYSEELSKDPEVMAKTYLQFAASLVKTDKSRGGEALSYAKKSLQIEKGTFSDEYKMIAAQCYIITGDHLQEKKSYDIAGVYYKKAKGYLDDLGDKEGSAEVLEKIEVVYALKNKDCETYKCLMSKGKIQMGEKEYDDAADYFEEAEQKARTGREKAAAIAKAGIAYFLNGNEKKALSKLNNLKSEYPGDYKKSKERSRIDLFLGASVILTENEPEKMATKLTDKLKGFLPGNKKEGGSSFVENVNSARNLILSATRDISEKTHPRFVWEAAFVCERVAERFEEWNMAGDARQFYEKSIACYKQLLNNEKVVALNRKLREMN